MDSVFTTKATTSNVGLKFITLRAELSKLLLMVLHVLLYQIKKFNLRKKYLLGYILTCLVLVPILLISNLFVIQQADAQSIGFLNKGNQPAIYGPTATSADINIVDTNATYPNLEITTVVNDVPTFLSHQIRTTLGDGTVQTTSKTNFNTTTGNAVSMTSQFGTWNLENSWPNRNAGRTNLRFTPNSVAINSILPEHTVKVEYILTAIGATGIFTLNLRHRTFLTWDHATEQEIETIEFPGTSAITQPNDGRLCFNIPRSQVNLASSGVNLASRISVQGSQLATEITLTEYNSSAYPQWFRDLNLNWSGNLWAADTTYGRWLVGNQETINPSAAFYYCYDVRFQPNASVLNNIGTNAVKLELNLTHNTRTNANLGTESETDILSYFVLGTDSNLTLALDSNSSNQITVVDGTASLADVTSTATGKKLELDEFDIAVTESTDNSGTLITTTQTNSTTTNMTAGFESLEYGTNLSLGSWYFAEDNSTTFLNETVLESIQRKILFKPNLAAIKALSANETRFSRITVSIKRKAATLTTQQFTVNMTRKIFPSFSITAVNSTIDEGGTAQFKISSDRNPGTTAITIPYTLTNSTGTYYTIPNDDAGNPQTSISKSASVPFTPDGNVWSGTFQLSLRAKDNIDEPDGMISVVLTQTDASNTATKYVVSTVPSEDRAAVTIKDLTTPVITISPNINVFSSLDAKFTLTSDIEPISTSTDPVEKKITIRYRPTNTAGNYLKTVAGKGHNAIREVELNFTKKDAESEYTATVSVPTMRDTVHPTSGTINIELLDDTEPTYKNYTISPTPSDNMRIITVDKIPIPQLTIREDRLIINEGESATIKVTANIDPVRPLSFRYLPVDNSDYTYLDTSAGTNSSSRLVEDLTFSPDPTIPGTWFANITIDTIPPDMIDRNHGDIIIYLFAPRPNIDFYTITSRRDNEISIRVNDDIKPEITLDNNVPVVSAGENIEITLTATLPSNVPITNRQLQPNRFQIQYLPTETGTTFLDVPNSYFPGTPRFHRVTFNEVSANSGIFTGTLEVPTQVDDDENEGTIRIALQTIQSRYTVSTTASEREAEITVRDPSYITNVTWIDTTDSTIHENPNTPEVGMANNARITTYHPTLADFTFESQLFDESVTADDLVLTQMEYLSEWNGMEWVAEVSKNEVSKNSVSYGHWVVGNQIDATAAATCDTGAKCFDVRFIPNESGINSISGKIVKFDLVVKLIPSGSVNPIETDTISYVVNANSIAVNLDENSTNFIYASSSIPTINDVDGEVIISKNITNTISIEAHETTTDQPTRNNRYRWHYSQY